MVDWTRETCKKSMAEVMKTGDAAAEEAKQSEEEPEIIADENMNWKITAAEALKKLAEVNIFIEVNGSDHLKYYL